MSNKRGQAGRIGISGNASVSMEKIAGENAGDPVPLPADENDDLLLAKMVGEDDNGDFQRVATDSNGRIKVKDVQFDGTVDIGDLQVLNTSEQKIDPATEGTLSTIETNTSGLAQESTLETTNTNLAGIENELSLVENNTSGIAQEDTLSTIETNTSGIAQESTLSTIETNTNGLFEASDFTETRTITQNNAGLFEASDFTEDRNVRELQNETGVTSGQDTGGGSLPSNAVPDGRTVRVQALQGNGAKIEIDGNFELVAGQAVDLAVDDTNKISYTANAGDGVCFIVEN